VNETVQNDQKIKCPLTSKTSFKANLRKQLIDVLYRQKPSYPMKLKKEK
jgi:hypothetical protein